MYAKTCFSEYQGTVEKNLDIASTHFTFIMNMYNLQSENQFVCYEINITAIYIKKLSRKPFHFYLKKPVLCFNWSISYVYLKILSIFNETCNGEYSLSYK